jgi:hypothetical protein
MNVRLGGLGAPIDVSGTVLKALHDAQAVGLVLDTVSARMWSDPPVYPVKETLGLMVVLLDMEQNYESVIAQTASQNHGLIGANTSEQLDRIDAQFSRAQKALDTTGIVRFLVAQRSAHKEVAILPGLKDHIQRLLIEMKAGMPAMIQLQDGALPGWLVGAALAIFDQGIQLRGWIDGMQASIAAFQAKADAAITAGTAAAKSLQQLAVDAGAKQKEVGKNVSHATTAVVVGAAVVATGVLALVARAFMKGRA